MLTPEQTDGYLERLRVLRKSPDLDYLNELIRAQLRSVPYENLSIHYSVTHSLSLDIPTLYSKIVVNGHGGYCMELNTLFGALLTALNFDVRQRAGRVWKVGSQHGPDGEGVSKHWTGWSHMVLLIQLHQDYLVDVGFGSNGPVTALAIPPIPTLGDIVAGVIPEEHQLGSIKAPHSPRDSVYIVRHRRDTHSPWTPLFTFDPNTPFSESDYEIMSFHSHCHPSSPFVSSILCTTVGFDQDGNAVTRMLLQNNVLKKRICGENRVVEKFDTEDSRLKAIERIWGINFNEMQKQGVNKWKVGLVGPEPERKIPIAGWS
jgi:arylamine N-acetyltransferase